jgi:transcription factor SFP1
MGMEKEKPFKCDICHKRYKNLNGLKYVGTPERPQ